MAGWPEFKSANGLRRLSDGSDNFDAFWSGVFQAVADEKIDTWDYQWQFSLWQHNGLAISPGANLVTNIGFGTDATHTRDPNNAYAGLDAPGIAFPLRHPPHIIRDVEFDRVLDRFRCARRSRAHMLQRF
jgi:hypothetical protein